MVTTWIFAVLFFLMLAWNGVLTALVVLSPGGMMVETGTVPTPVEAPAVAPTPAPTPAPAPVAVSAGDSPSLGSPDAPVLVIEFSEFECPFCARYYRDSYQQIKEQYVDSGKVRYVYRHFPLSFHQRAMPSAVASECVRELSDDVTFFAYHDLLFENQDSLDDASLRSFAQRVGVSGAAFDACYRDADGSMRARVERDFSDGQRAGVSGTPTVFVNGQKIVGAQPYATFEAAIEAALTAAGQ